MIEYRPAMTMPTGLAAPSSQVRYTITIWRRSALLMILLAFAVMAFVADLIVGSGTLTFNEAVSGLLNPSSVDTSVRVILWELRMPMTLMAVLAGTCLSLAGLMMQTVLDNPLAEPFTLGISSAAGFGASLALAFSWRTAAKVRFSGLFKSICTWCPRQLIGATVSHSNGRISKRLMPK